MVLGPVIDLKATGEKIKSYNREHHYTASYIADCCCVHVQSVYKWYRGECVPTIDNLVILADRYGCRIDDIIVTTGWSDEVGIGVD